MVLSGVYTVCCMSDIFIIIGKQNCSYYGKLEIYIEKIKSILTISPINEMDTVQSTLMTV